MITQSGQKALLEDMERIPRTTRFSTRKTPLENRAVVLSAILPGEALRLLACDG
jgi:hypothetical protein